MNKSAFIFITLFCLMASSATVCMIPSIRGPLAHRVNPIYSREHSDLVDQATLVLQEEINSNYFDYYWGICLTLSVREFNIKKAR